MKPKHRFILLMTATGGFAGLMDADQLLGDAFAGAVFMFIVSVAAVWVVREDAVKARKCKVPDEDPRS